MGSEGLVLINYMQGGGHYEWEQCIESQTWKETVRSLIQRLRSRHRLAFLCHDRTEYESCREIDPSLERIRPRRAGEYFDLVSSAKGALCNRLHASVALASLGIPSVAVGTDTRLLMVKALGLPHFYVKDVDCDVLEHELEGVLQRRFLEQDRLLSLRAEAWTRYLESLEGVVCS